MFEISHKELDNIMVQIDQAIDNHAQWHRQLVRTLICKLPSDQRDTLDNAHTLCRFGQWYYQYSNPAMRANPIFAAMEFEHKQLHAQAAKLLQISVAEIPVDAIVYDQFANTLERLRLQLFSMKHEIESELYNHDPLTGAYTRYGLLTELREQQEMISRGTTSCAIAMIDLDNFKMVNDQYGHKLGDSMLTNFASTLIKGLRPYDKLYRYGGEEFIIIFPNTTLENALSISERLRGMIEASALDVDHLHIRITASFGVTMIHPDMSVEISLEEADKAMYAAKKNGRNQVKLWEPSLAQLPAASTP
jgi:diguanylate cyclase (GGDEF)-like protein